MYILLADSPRDVTHIESAVDDMFRNSHRRQEQKLRATRAGLLAIVGQCEGLHSQHMHGCGVCDLAGVGQHHGHDDPGADAEVALLKTLGFTRAPC